MACDISKDHRIQHGGSTEYIHQHGPHPQHGLGTASPVIAMAQAIDIHMATYGNMGLRCQHGPSGRTVEL